MPLRLPEHLRAELAKPWGAFFREGPDELPLFLESSRLIAVGDVTTEMLMSRGLEPKVQVVDGKVMRFPHPLPTGGASQAVSVMNPPGYITEEALDALGRGISSPTSLRIIVDGEEDLLALAAIANAPDGWVVAYGQPREGLVLVCVEPGIRKRAKAILAAMEHVQATL